MKRLNKKGFTIVELIIVIAVIAILAAILIPVISNLINRAHVAKDTTLVRNLNTALSMDTTTEKHETMQQALDAAAAYGYDLAKINASAVDNLILWDSENDVFCYYIKEGDAEPKIEYIPDSVDPAKALSADSYKLWIISDVVNDTYSTYYIGNAATISTSKGFDAGNCSTIEAINYTNSASAQNVVIRTNGGTLTINAPTDTVKHYGTANVLVVDAIASASYHEFGTIFNAQIKIGRIVLENKDSNIENLLLIAKEDKSGFEDIIIETKSDAQMPTFDRTDVNIAENGTLVVNLVTPVSDEFIYLTKAGVIEQIVVTTDEVNTATTNVATVPTAKAAEETSTKTYTVAEQVANVGQKNEEGKYVADDGITVVELDDLNSVEQIATEEKASKEDTDNGVTYFAGGAGTQVSPFLIATAQQFYNIDAAVGNVRPFRKGYCFRLINDISTEVGFIDNDQAVCYFQNGAIFDGDNHTITFNANNADIFYAVENENTTIKNLNVVLNGTNIGLCNIAKDTTFENITISGDVEFTESNRALFVEWFYCNDASNRTLNLINCVNNANIRCTGSGNNYDAIFVGRTNGSSNTSYTPTINYVNCINNGNVVGEKFSIFLANPNFNKMHLHLNITDFANYGTIRVLNAITNFNYYFATTTNVYNTYYINDDAYSSDSYSDLPSPENDNTIANYGLYVKTTADATLAISVNDNKTFAVTAASDANVTSYTVFIGTYTTIYNEDGTTNGSARFYVSQDLDAAGNTVIKDFGFVDQQWVNANPSAIEGELDGNTIYTLNGNSYYMIDDAYVPGTAGYGFGGKVKTETLISVVGYNANGDPVCSAMLNR